MRQILITSVIGILAVSSSFAAAPARVDSLFICTGGSARTYHTDRSCTGLVKCGGKIVSLPAYIIVKKKRLCRKCEAAADSYVIPALRKSDKAVGPSRSTGGHSDRPLRPAAIPGPGASGGAAGRDAARNSWPRRQETVDAHGRRKAGPDEGPIQPEPQ